MHPEDLAGVEWCNRGGAEWNIGVFVATGPAQPAGAAPRVKFTTLLVLAAQDMNSRSPPI
jgi:hypothetical protein